MRRIIWFRRDLRVDDNPLLSLEGEVLPIFIFDPSILDHLEKNDRRVTFIYQALLSLKESLKKRGLNLALFYGNPTEVFDWLLTHEHFDQVCASGDYDSYARERDLHISRKIEFNYLLDTYIFNPNEVVKSDGTPYLVFTPFYNRAQSIFSPEHMREYFPASQQIIPFEYDLLHCIAKSLHTTRTVGLESIGFERSPLPPSLSQTATEKLEQFHSKIINYAKDRDYIGVDGTSHLSTELRFGTLSIRALLRWLLERQREGIDTEPFFRELIFREFYAMLLYHYPHVSEKNFRYPFKGVENSEYYRAFCTARTGVPIVDAGITELLRTGEMHNRVRMIAASFFTKNLLLPWQWGEAFFAAHLNDYDAASNILSWQWSAGTGVDPQPYFRIFNPYTQGLKFDPDASYVYRWLPSLTSLDPKTLYTEKRVSLHNLPNYPTPIVDHKISSKKALDYYKSI
jgi:deoxyribodipyrimidine photo-lyase